MTESRKARVPLLDRTVPFVRLPADLTIAAALFAVLNFEGAAMLISGRTALGAVLIIAATVIAGSALAESMRRERKGG